VALHPCACLVLCCVLQTIRDLLVSDSEARQQRTLQLVNSQRSGSNVPDAIQVSFGGAGTTVM